MRLTKHHHSCVELEDGPDRLIIDPGVLTPDAPRLLGTADAVLLTHEHPDHVDADAIAAALDARPDLRVLGPEAVVARWREPFHAQVHAVAEGDAFAVGGIDVEVHGRLHAVIHPDVPRVANVGYLVAGRVFHPGDSYDVPAIDVDVLLVPVSAPWLRVADTVEYVRAVAPGRAIAIHEGAASEFGLRAAHARLGEGGLTGVPVELLAPGETVEV